MADRVKSPPSLRQEQAQATRERIAMAARTLFATQGYSTTSMEAVAREAGVASRTVYTAYGAKREILSAICERWLADARARERAAEVLDRTDPTDRLHGAAHWLAALYAAGFDVVQILEAARDEDPQTRKLLRGKLAGRNRVMDSMVASVEGRLRLPLEEAQALFRAMAAPGVYESLVVETGWSPERFGDWLGELLEHQLLKR